MGIRRGLKGSRGLFPPKQAVLEDQMQSENLPGTPATEARSATGEATHAVLNDPNFEIPDADLMAILDRIPHDEKVHAAIIKRAFLSEQVVARLVTLVSPVQFDALASRHVLPGGSAREGMKRQRGRPSWWRRGLFN